MEPLENSPSPHWPADARQSHADRWAGLGTRILSAAVLGAVAFACLWQGGFVFSAFVMLAGLVMKKEWDALITQPSTILRAGGYAYVILPCASLIWLRSLENAGTAVTLALIAVISATDIGAYFVGRRFGRHKLSPAISPGKTWEGLAGGIIAATLAALLLSSAIPVPHTRGSIFWIAPFIALLAQAGDLFESSLKRRAGVKDSGSLLPGHGGLLDRLDGYMFAAPVFALLVHSAGV
jgi:phosphatidate cytidylyltransferase